MDVLEAYDLKVGPPIKLGPWCGLWLMTKMFSYLHVDLPLGSSHIQYCCFLLQSSPPVILMIILGSI